MTRKVKTEHTLSNGQSLKVLQGTGRDMVNAERLAPKGSTMGMAMAMVCSKVLIDDKPVTYDEFLDMDDELVQEILLIANGSDPKENFTSAPNT
jgi:hypothetical protein